MTAFFIAVLIADAGGIIPAFFIVKYLLMTFVVSFVCDFICMILLIRALIEKKMKLRLPGE